jgi:heptosyltransferase-1
VNLSACESLLIVKPSSLGDIVHALPAAAAIRRAAPEARLDWLANSEWAPILEGSPAIDRVIAFPRRQFRGLGGILRARAWARSELSPRAYGLAIDFQGLLRSAWLARRAGATTAGFRNSREGAALFYNERFEVSDWSRRHAIDRNLALAAALGAEAGEVSFPLPAGTPPATLPPLDRPPIVLHPFSRGRGKSLSAKEAGELCASLAPHPVVLVGAATETGPAPWPANAIDLLGRTSLPELIHLLRSAAWTVSVDSGPMHLAAALSDRVLSLHTWSNPAMVGPWPKGAWIWRESRLVRMGDLDPDEFPERRDLAARHAAAARLLAPPDVEAIAEFVRDRLEQQSTPPAP